MEERLGDGEQWTRDALARLREHGFTPGAWRAFVARSLRRAGDARRARPDLARQARRWGALGGLAWIAVARRLRLRALPGLSWWLLVVRMLDWHLGMTDRSRLSSADAISLARFWALPLIVGVRHRRRTFPLVVAAAAVTDLADGAVARRTGPTRLGRDLDSTADLAFTIATAGAAAAAGCLPARAAVALLTRATVGAAVTAGGYFGRARRPELRPRRWDAALRSAGLVLATAGRTRLATVMILSGSAIPPGRPTSPARP